MDFALHALANRCPVQRNGSACAIATILSLAIATRITSAITTTMATVMPVGSEASRT